MHRFLASVICLLGISGCINPGFNYTPLDTDEGYYTPSAQSHGYRPPEPAQQPAPAQQPLIVPQYVPIPQPYFVPMGGGYPQTMGNNPYIQQIVRQKMDNLSQSYTAHNLNVANEPDETNIEIDEEQPQPFSLRHPQTNDVVFCARSDYPCVYAYEDQGYVRMKTHKQKQSTPQSYRPETSAQPAYSNTIPRW